MSEKKKINEQDFIGMLCPHCKGAIKVRLSPADVSDVHPRIIAGEQEEATRPDGREVWLSSLDPHSRAIIQMADTAGLLPPFTAAFEAAHNMRPRFPEKSFLGWAKLAIPKIVPGFAVDHYTNEYGGNISFVGHQSIMAVLSNTVIVEFLPSREAMGEKRKIGNVRVAATPTLEQLKAWTRTRNGYVAFRGALFDELKGKAAGEFARPMIESGSNY